MRGNREGTTKNWKRCQAGSRLTSNERARKGCWEEAPQAAIQHKEG